MTLEELRKLQLLQTDVLTLVDKICRENHLNYYLIGGTLIGAVRHKGFIPWDFDVDIAMYRLDYIKFLELARPYIPSDYTLQYTAIDNNCEISFARLLLNKAIIADSYGNMNKAQFDIFILDYVEKENKIMSSIKEKLVLLLSYIRSYKINRWKFKGNNSWWKKGIIRIGNALTWGLKGENFDNLIKNITYYKEFKTDYTSIISSRYGYVKETHSTKYFEDTVELDFEGSKRLAPVGYDKILRKTYGDYMVPPPENKRYLPNFEGLKVIFKED